MRKLLMLTLALPLLAQEPTPEIAVTTASGKVALMPDFYRYIDYAEFPVLAAFREDYPKPNRYTAATWQPEAEQQAMGQVVELADGGRVAAQVIVGPIKKRAWPHEAAARLWYDISTQARASGESVYTAEARWARRYWEWWLAWAKSQAPGVNVEKESEVHAKFGEDAPLTHWRSDLIQRGLEWRKADQMVSRGGIAPQPNPTIGVMMAGLEARLRDGE